MGYPSPGDVRNGTPFGASNELVGTCIVPSNFNVREGLGYDAGGSVPGTYHVPAVGDVRLGVAFDPHLALVGTLALPDDSDVRYLTFYGEGGGEFAGKCKVPTASNVRKGVVFDDIDSPLTGTFPTTEFDDMSVRMIIGAMVDLLDNRDVEAHKNRDLVRTDMSQTLANGTGVDQVDAWWNDRRTLAAAAEDIDIRGGLTDSFGVALAFQKLKVLIIRNRSTVAGEILTVGGDANSVPLFGAANDTIKVGPGGLFLWINPSLAGVAVAAGTGDIIQVDSGAATISYDLIVGGVKV